MYRDSQINDYCLLCESLIHFQLQGSILLPRGHGIGLSSPSLGPGGRPSTGPSSPPSSAPPASSPPASSSLHLLQLGWWDPPLPKCTLPAEVDMRSRYCPTIVPRSWNPSFYLFDKCLPLVWTSEWRSSEPLIFNYFSRLLFSGKYICSEINFTVNVLRNAIHTAIFLSSCMETSGVINVSLNAQ